MTQSNLNIPPGATNAAILQIQAMLQALASSSAGATDPATAYVAFPSQIWSDTANHQVKMRSEANDAWGLMATFDQTYHDFAWVGASVQASRVTGLVIKDSSGATQGTFGDGTYALKLDGGLSTTSLNDGQLAGFRNAIINGNFSVNQRGVSGTVTLAAGARGHDRWKAGAAGCTYTYATAGGVTTLTISAGSLQQVIKGSNLRTGTYVVSWSGTAQGKVAGGAYAASGFTVAATVGTNLTLEFGTGTLSLVQCEPGTVATPFEWREAIEESLCWPYFEIGSGQFTAYNTAGASCSIRLNFKARKIGTPTLNYAVSAAVNVGVHDVRDADTQGARWYAEVSSTGNMQWDGTWTAEFEL